MDRIRSRVRPAHDIDRLSGVGGVVGLLLVGALLALGGSLRLGPLGSVGFAGVSGDPGATDQPNASAASFDPIGTFDPGYSGQIPEQPSPVPGVTPPPEVDPGYLNIPGVTLPPHSSLQVLAESIGADYGGYTPVSFHLQMTLGADFGTRLDRSIRLLGADNIRYLADEAVVQPALLTEPGYQLDGWVTFQVPTGLSGAAILQITIDPANLTEIVVPVAIGDGVAQPSGVFLPTVVIDQPTPLPTGASTPSAADTGPPSPTQPADSFAPIPTDSVLP